MQYEKYFPQSKDESVNSKPLSPLRPSGGLLPTCGTPPSEPPCSDVPLDHLKRLQNDRRGRPQPPRTRSEGRSACACRLATWWLPEESGVFGQTSRGLAENPLRGCGRGSRPDLASPPRSAPHRTVQVRLAVLTCAGTRPQTCLHPLARQGVFGQTSGSPSENGLRQNGGNGASAPIT